MRTTSYIVAAIAALALGACATRAPSPSVDTQILERRARTQAQSGNPAAAAQAYRELADAAAGDERSRYLVAGARLMLAAGDAATASRWLSEALSSAGAQRRNEIVALLARADLESGRPEAALQRLAAIEQPVPLPVQQEAAEVRGRALLAVGRVVDGVRELVEREIWLDDADAIIANQRLIWDALPSQTAAAPTGDSIVDGWLALAPVASVQIDSAEFRRRLLEWRRTYFDHPAAGGLLAELLSAQRAEGPPAQIALLLPLETAQRTQAIAVRDGFMAAHLESGSARESSVRVYDTGSQGAAAAYLEAQLDGADFIVGPLLRQEVEEVMAQSGFVPTLALNWAQVDAPFLQSFYQFGLAPEDEVRAIAQRAIAADHRTAVALVASDDRGYRLLNTFREEFEALGGRILASTGYVPGAQDVSGAIRDLLNVSRSEQRHRRLEANLGVDIGFEPRRRRDVDMIFLQADPRMGRLLAPNLRFFYAGDIPTYATAEIYEPANRGGDRDLNGVMFPDVPLLLTPDQRSASLTRELEAYWPQRGSQWIRLYGLGFDAYELTSALYGGTGAQWPVEGFSGELTVDPTGHIRRGLPIAQFRNGLPVALEPLPSVEPPPSVEPLPSAGSREFVGSR